MKFVPEVPGGKMSKEHVAHHEAAHAVVAAIYEIDVNEMALDPDGRGHTSLNNKRGNSRAQVRAILAGPVMSAMRGEQTGAGKDGADAFAIMHAVFGDSMKGIRQIPGMMLEEAFAVRRILEMPSVKGAVEALAARLIERGRMEEAELKAYLAPLMGRFGAPE